jgi:hypothetical protein
LQRFSACKQVGDKSAHERTDNAQQNCHPKAYRLPTRHQQAGEESANEPKHGPHDNSPNPPHLFHPPVSSQLIFRASKNSPMQKLFQTEFVLQLQCQSEDDIKQTGQ